MRIATAMAVACLSLAGLAGGVDAQAVAREYDLNIPEQSLDMALRDLAQQTGLQIALLSDTIDGSALVGPVIGTRSAEEALQALLKPRGLSFKVVAEGTIAVLNPKESQARATFGTQQAFLWNRVRLAQADTSASVSAATEALEEVAGRSRRADLALEEVIVSAQKRQERLQDVPVPVTAISADVLVSSNQLRIQDYYTSIPGLSVTPIGAQTQLINIRGIATGGGNPTVGILIDDVPFGSSTFLGGGRTVPDIDPGDLARVEVLRGPQGTLYGTSSIGGLLKFVTIDPSTAGPSGRMHAGVSHIQNGPDTGYDVRGSINVALSDTWAIRASGFIREESGYIDNPLLGTEGVNKLRGDGARLSALWRPSQTVSLKLSALYQTTEGDGREITATQASIGGSPLQTLGDLQQGYIAGTGSYEDETQAYSAIWSATLGDADLVSLTGYNVHTNSSVQDYSNFFGSFTQALFGVAGAPATFEQTSKKFTQELRLTVPLGSRVEWLLGGFYTEETTDPFTFRRFASDPITGEVVAHWGTSSFPSRLREYAGFTDLTYRFTDRFDVQFGARQSRITEASSQTDNIAGSVTFLPLEEVTANAFSYLVTPRFNVSPDLMVYARLASGYRPGGPNLSPNVPREFDPDKTQNYEIGIKGEFLDRTLAVDTSVYYIDWRDIQIQLFDLQAGRSYIGNAGRATSQGLEFAIQWRVLRDLTVGAWAAWNRAELKEHIPAAALVRGIPGDRLPYSPRLSGNLTVDQEFPLNGTVTGFVGGTVSYVSDRATNFRATAQRPTLPSYAKTDLRAGLRYGSWTFNLFANNVTNERGILAGDDLGPFLSIPIQPRLIGLSAVKTFSGE